MRIFTTLTAAATIVALSTSAMAGGLSDEIVEAPDEVLTPAEPTGSSVKPIYIVLGVLAALLLAEALDDDDDDDDDDDGGLEDEVVTLQ